MELSEFKELWQSGSANSLVDKYNSQKLNEIIMNANKTVDGLHSTNLFWWSFTKISTIILFGVFALNVMLLLIDPDPHLRLKTALPFVAIIAICGLITLWLYYEQTKIFDIKDAENMRSAIETSLQRFSRFYSLLTIVNLIVFPVLSYIGILLIDMGFVQIEFILDKRIVFQSVFLTFVGISANHWYYKKKYFSRLSQLKSSLKELNQETPHL